MLLNGVTVLMLRYFTDSVAFGPITLKWLKIDLNCLLQTYCPKNIVFSGILFVAIFVEVAENECIIERRL